MAAPRRRARPMLKSTLAMSPSGNPALTSLSKINERLDGHDRRLEDHEVRITATEREQREAARDFAILSDLVMRANQRAGMGFRTSPRPKPRRPPRVSKPLR